ncbi:hypothetical protein ACF0H5_013377 [Mactra antiquata]
MEELENLLQSPSTSKRLTSRALDLSNEENVDGMGENVKGLYIDVVSKHKVIIKHHKPKIIDDKIYDVNKTSRKRKLSEKSMAQHAACVNCGYKVYETDFTITCDKCHKLVHKGCWDDMFDRIFLTERLKWNSNFVKREPKRPKLCSSCFDYKASKKSSTGKNEKIKLDAPTLSKRGKIQIDKTSMETRSSTKAVKVGVQELHQSKDSKMEVHDETVDTSPDTDYNRHVSTLVSNALDGIGYSIEMIKYRQRLFIENDSCVNKFKTQPDERVTTGGKAEGTTMYYESDTDYMFVVKDTVCTDDMRSFESFKYITLIQTESKGCSPGYTRLKLVKLAGRHYRNVINKSAVVMENGEEYLSNVRYIDGVLDNEEVFRNRDGFVAVPVSGPSTPITHRYDSFDNVIALRCYCSKLIKQWLSRPRPNNWPTKEDLEWIAQLEAHAVPVGYKGSINQEFEWRVCYSLAELYLMKSLNECQIQIYIALKMLAKNCLQSISKDITSYVLKNVTLWVCESRPIGDFQKDCLLERTLDGLKFLQKCLKENNLPSYMISRRNLLAGRITADQRRQLSDLLETLITERARLFLRISKINDAIFAMHKVPDSLEEYGKKRNRLERLVLLRSWIREDVWLPGMNRGLKFQVAGKHVAYLPLERDMEVILNFDEVGMKRKGKSMTEIDALWVRMIQMMMS